MVILLNFGGLLDIPSAELYAGNPGLKVLKMGGKVPGTVPIPK